MSKKDYTKLYYKQLLLDSISRIELLETKTQILEEKLENKTTFSGSNFKTDVYQRTKEKIENPTMIEKSIQAKILQMRHENKASREIAKLLSEPLSKIERLTAYMVLRGENIPNYRNQKSRESEDSQIEIADLVESYLDRNIPIYKISRLVGISGPKIETLIYKYLIAR